MPALKVQGASAFAARLKESLEEGFNQAGVKVQGILIAPIKGTKLHRVEIVASGFNRMNPSERQALVWRIVERQFSHDEQLKIASFLTLSAEEAKAAAPRKPRPYPMKRDRDLGWQVFVTDEDEWLNASTKEEAEILSQTPVLRYEVLEERKTGPAFAKKLRVAAAAWQKHGNRHITGWLKSQAHQV